MILEIYFNKYDDLCLKLVREALKKKPVKVGNGPKPRLPPPPLPLANLGLLNCFIFFYFLLVIWAL